MHATINTISCYYTPATIDTSLTYNRIIRRIRYIGLEPIEVAKAIITANLYLESRRAVSLVGIILIHSLIRVHIFANRLYKAPYHLAVNSITFKYRLLVHRFFNANYRMATRIHLPTIARNSFLFLWVQTKGVE